LELMTVSKTARQLGCSERWLREAEKAGKIPKARRDLNGWRVYTEEDIEEIRRLLFPTVDKCNVDIPCGKAHHSG